MVMNILAMYRNKFAFKFKKDKTSKLKIKINQIKNFTMQILLA